MAKKRTKPKAAPASDALLKRKARQLLACRDAGREAYSTADALLGELLSAGLRPGDSIPLGGGSSLVIVDNFLDSHGQPKNKVWKPTGVNRYDCEVKQAQA